MERFERKCSCFANPKELQMYASAIGFIGNIDHYRLIYLYYETNKNAEEISKITHYAFSTIRTYSYKYKHYREKAKELFETIWQSNSCKIIVECDREYLHLPCAYIMELYDEYGNIKYLKDGKSIHTFERAKEHLNTYSDVDFIIIKCCFPCDCEESAYQMEQELIKWHKKRYPSFYIKKDRFRGVYFDDEILSDPKVLAIYELLKA